MLVRADGAGGTKQFLAWLTGGRVSYSVGFTLPFHTADRYRLIPEDFWEPAIDTDRRPRDGADVAEFTGILDLPGWPEGMRVIVRRERPHSGLYGKRCNSDSGGAWGPEARERAWCITEE